VSKIAKLLEKMRNNPSDWVLSDLERIASHFNIIVRQGKGSHVYFSFLHGATLSVPAKRPIKAIYTAFLDSI
jgi:hypothetical protein